MSVAAGVSVLLASGGDLAAWQDFVDAMPGANCMHHAGWHEVLRLAYRVRPLFLMACEPGGIVVGILPAYFSRSFLTGPHLSTLEGGALARSEAALQALFAEAMAVRDRLGARYLQVRGGPVPAAAETTVRYIHTAIDTARAREEIWRGIKRKTRWGIRQAEKQGIDVAHDPSLDGLADFYAAYAAHMRDLGTPVIGFATFTALRDAFGRDRLRLYLLRLDGHVIGGMLCILNRSRWTDYFAVARHAEEAEFANYLLYWHVIRDAAAAGVAEFDLGRSTPDSNVHLFKRKWGGHDTDVPYYFYLAPGRTSSEFGLERLKQQKGPLQRAWTHLPLVVANRLGPVLRRQLPFI